MNRVEKEAAQKRWRWLALVVIAGLAFFLYLEAHNLATKNCQALETFVDASVEREERFGQGGPAAQFWITETGRLKRELLDC